MKKYTDLNIASLILATRASDDDAFLELVERYTPLLRKITFSFVGSGLNFDELMAEGCVALHSAALHFDLTQEGVSFGLYLDRCVRNRMLDLLRSRCESFGSLDEISDAVGDEDFEEDLINRETVSRLLLGAHSLLSDYEYRVLILHIQGYKTFEIAGMLNRTAKSIDNAKSRVFRRLRASAGDSSES